LISSAAALGSAKRISTSSSRPVVLSPECPAESWLSPDCNPAGVSAAENAVLSNRAASLSGETTVVTAAVALTLAGAPEGPSPAGAEGGVSPPRRRQAASTTIAVAAAAGTQVDRRRIRPGFP